MLSFTLQRRSLVTVQAQRKEERERERAWYVQ